MITKKTMLGILGLTWTKGRCDRLEQRGGFGEMKRKSWLDPAQYLNYEDEEALKDLHDFLP